MSAVNFVVTASYVSTSEGNVPAYNQSSNRGPSIKCFTVRTSCAGDLLTSAAVSATILGGLMNVGPHISESLSSERSLDKLHKMWARLRSLKPRLGSAVGQLLD